MKRLLLLTLALVLGCTIMAYAQVTDSILIGLQAAAGYTAIDLPTALEWDEDDFEEWDQIYGRVSAQVLFFQAGPFLLGAEISWNRLYYYFVEVSAPPATYEATVQPIGAGVIGQMELVPRVVLHTQLGLVFFDDGTTLGLRGGLVYRIPVSEKLAVPVGGTIDVVFGDGTPTGLALALGIEYSADLNR